MLELIQWRPSMTKRSRFCSTLLGSFLRCLPKEKQPMYPKHLCSHRWRGAIRSATTGDSGSNVFPWPMGAPHGDMTKKAPMIVRSADENVSKGQLCLWIRQEQRNILLTLTLSSKCKIPDLKVAVGEFLPQFQDGIYYYFGQQ